MTVETVKTEVGSYFISNYPPFSQWSREQLGTVEAALREPPAPVPLGLYLHIPFCRKRCHFCYFKVYTDKDSTAIKAYLDLAIRELIEKEGADTGCYLEAVRCLGCCTAAPAVEIDGKLLDKEEAKKAIIQLKGEK